MSNAVRLHIITDDARFACLSVFGIGLYGLPDWAAIADTAEAIEAIPNGSRVLRCWHFETSQSRYLQRLAVERWAARELIPVPQAWIDKIEAMIAERDQLPPASSEPSNARPADVPANDAHTSETTQKVARASKWH